MHDGTASFLSLVLLYFITCILYVEIRVDVLTHIYQCGVSVWAYFVFCPANADEIIQKLCTLISADGLEEHSSKVRKIFI